MSGRRLVAAAAELITEQGWEATTAAEIGRRAGYSRAMVHARYGSKDAILDTLFRNQYEQRLRPAPDPDATGLQQAFAQVDRILQLHTEDREFLRAMFVLSFEAVKQTSPARTRVRKSLKQGARTVADGLRKGIEDGSVRRDVDIQRAANDITAAVFGVAYQWIVLAGRYNPRRELEYVRARLIQDYGSK